MLFALLSNNLPTVHSRNPFARVRGTVKLGRHLELVMKDYHDFELTCLQLKVSVYSRTVLLQQASLLSWGGMFWIIWFFHIQIFHLKLWQMREEGEYVLYKKSRIRMTPDNVRQRNSIKAAAFFFLIWSRTLKQHICLLFPFNPIFFGSGYQLQQNKLCQNKSRAIIGIPQESGFRRFSCGVSCSYSQIWLESLWRFPCLQGVYMMVLG